MAFVPNSILLLVLCGTSGSKPSWADVTTELSTEGDLGALPVNETSGSDVEMKLICPCNVVSWLIGVSACRLLACLLRSLRFRLRLPLPRFFLVVLPLSLESWRHPGHCSEPWMLCRCFLGMWGLSPHGIKTFMVLWEPRWWDQQQLRLSTCSASSFSLRQPQQQLRLLVCSPIRLGTFAFFLVGIAV